MVYIYFNGHPPNQFCLWGAKHALASEDPNGDPIATPSICLYNLLLNMKFDPFIAKIEDV